MSAGSAGKAGSAEGAGSAGSAGKAGSPPGKRRRWRRMALWISGAVVLVVAGLGLYVYLTVQHTAERMYQPLPADRPKYVARDPELRQLQDVAGEGAPAQAAPNAPADLPANGGALPQPAAVQVQAKARSPGAFTALLLGVDQRPGDRGRSDTIMVATVNPNSGKALLFNIPRDTRTRLVKRGYDDKINHAYAYDGIAGAMATVENFLDMPIDYYVQVNMEGFETIVDQLGGVDVDSAFAFDIDGFYFPKGAQHLNGEYALKYARMRFEDPRGDFGRNERQRQVVRNLYHRVTQWDNVAAFAGLLDTIGDHVRTNLTFDQMQKMFVKYRTKVATIESTEIKGQGTRIGGIYYYLVNDTERTRIHDAMKAELLED